MCDFRTSPQGKLSGVPILHTLKEPLHYKTGPAPSHSKQPLPQTGFTLSSKILFGRPKSSRQGVYCFLGSGRKPQTEWIFLAVIRNRQEKT
jgi:hypothetical protein